MSRRTYIFFALFAVFCAVLIPAWAISHEGGESASPEDVPASLEQGKELFVTNCGACHTLDKAGTDGVIGPNLDDLLGNASPEANKVRVLNAINTGINGRMPRGIVAGEDADTVADFVAQTAGE
ncbi:MAG: c-type cytochrome [Solirubrobacterales bacterium]